MNRLINTDTFRTMIENLPDVIIVADQYEIITLINKEAETIFGYSASELIGKSISALAPERLKETYLSERKKIFSKYQKGRIPGNRKVKGKRKNGSEFDADVSISIVTYEGGFYSISSIRDITDVKVEENRLSQQNQTLETINKELEKYNYTISHDLKSPLQKIEALTTVLLDELKEGKSAEELKQVSDFIKESVTTAEKIITDTLDEARKTGCSNNETINIDELIEDLKKLLVIPGNFKFEFNCEFPFVPGKKINLLQVFMNLLSNSIKYNDKPNGEICVTCKDAGENYVFTFSDNGKGIAPEKLDKIFELFEKGTTSPSESHGIGLNTVKSIIESRGGNIKVESKVGVGTKFAFTWPKVKKRNQ